MGIDYIPIAEHVPAVTLLPLARSQRPVRAVTSLPQQPRRRATPPCPGTYKETPARV